MSPDYRIYCNVLIYISSHTPMFLCLSFQLHSNSDKGDGSVRYILSGEGAGSIFIINEVTGDIHATKSLDREKKSHYVLHAQAIDRNNNKPLEPESEFIIKVQDINDNAPKFPDGPFVTSVPEMSEVGEISLLIFPVKCFLSTFFESFMKMLYSHLINLIIYYS